MYLRDGCESHLGSSSLEGTHPDNSARKNFSGYCCYQSVIQVAFRVQASNILLDQVPNRPILTRGTKRGTFLCTSLNLRFC